MSAASPARHSSSSEDEAMDDMKCASDSSWITTDLSSKSSGNVRRVPEKTHRGRWIGLTGLFLLVGVGVVALMLSLRPSSDSDAGAGGPGTLPISTPTGQRGTGGKSNKFLKTSRVSRQSGGSSGASSPSSASGRTSAGSVTLAIENKVTRENVQEAGAPARDQMQDEGEEQLRRRSNVNAITVDRAPAENSTTQKAVEEGEDGIQRAYLVASQQLQEEPHSPEPDYAVSSRSVSVGGGSAPSRDENASPAPNPQTPSRMPPFTASQKDDDTRKPPSNTPFLAKTEESQTSPRTPTQLDDTTVALAVTSSSAEDMAKTSQKDIGDKSSEGDSGSPGSQQREPRPRDPARCRSASRGRSRHRVRDDVSDDAAEGDKVKEGTTTTDGDASTSFSSSSNPAPTSSSNMRAPTSGPTTTRKDPAAATASRNTTEGELPQGMRSSHHVDSTTDVTTANRGRSSVPVQQMIAALASTLNNQGGAGEIDALARRFSRSRSGSRTRIQEVQKRLAEQGQVDLSLSMQPSSTASAKEVQELIVAAKETIPALDERIHEYKREREVARYTVPPGWGLRYSWPYSGRPFGSLHFGQRSSAQPLLGDSDEQVDATVESHEAWKIRKLKLDSIVQPVAAPYQATVLRRTYEAPPPESELILDANEIQELTRALEEKSAALLLEKSRRTNKRWTKSNKQQGEKNIVAGRAWSRSTLDSSSGNPGSTSMGDDDQETSTPSTSASTARGGARTGTTPLSRLPSVDVAPLLPTPPPGSPAAEGAFLVTTPTIMKGREIVHDLQVEAGDDDEPPAEDWKYSDEHLEVVGNHEVLTSKNKKNMGEGVDGLDQAPEKLPNQDQEQGDKEQLAAMVALLKQQIALRQRLLEKFKVASAEGWRQIGAQPPPGIGLWFAATRNKNVGSEAVEEGNPSGPDRGSDAIPDAAADASSSVGEDNHNRTVSDNTKSHDDLTEKNAIATAVSAGNTQVNRAKPMPRQTPGLGEDTANDVDDLFARNRIPKL
ncbi:unnamed protein product [Amoebophrya sp. A25]|nr:unnamed protein product [Amoebophrya sp. A25]|eukprot:GSA25T00006096001.1